MNAKENTQVLVRNASVWLCENGKSEFTGYVRQISPVGFTAVLASREPISDTVDAVGPNLPIPDASHRLIGRTFLASLCGRRWSALVDCQAVRIQKLVGRTFDFAITCRFKNLDHEQKESIVHLILEQNTPPSLAG